QRLPQSRSPPRVLSPNHRRQKGNTPPLRLDQPQTPPAAGSRPNHQNPLYLSLSANFRRSQDHHRYPQRLTFHRCPAHACNSPTHARRRLTMDTQKKSSQTANIFGFHNIASATTKV